MQNKIKLPVSIFVHCPRELKEEIRNDITYSLTGGQVFELPVLPHVTIRRNTPPVLPDNVIFEFHQKTKWQEEK